MAKGFLIRHVAALGALALTALPALADSNSASFDVTVQVLASCSISSSNMTFSSITTGTTSNSDAASSLTVNCSSGTPYTIALGNGSNYMNVRRMAWGGSYLNYLLYQDSARTAEWNGVSTKAGTGNGSDQLFTIYGRIPSGQTLTNTGSYGDTVIATVTY
ncbi:spore coat U domain-containing protein [beta proteobacterium MWH-UniP1]